MSMNTPTYQSILYEYNILHFEDYDVDYEKKSALLKKLKHEHIVKCLEPKDIILMYDNLGETPMFEPMGASLEQLLIDLDRKLCPVELSIIFEVIGDALSYLHSKQISFGVVCPATIAVSMEQPTIDTIDNKLRRLKLFNFDRAEEYSLRTFNEARENGIELAIDKEIDTMKINVFLKDLVDFAEMLATIASDLERPKVWAKFEFAITLGDHFAKTVVYHLLVPDFLSISELDQEKQIIHKTLNFLGFVQQLNNDRQFLATHSISPLGDDIFVEATPPLTTTIEPVEWYCEDDCHSEEDNDGQHSQHSDDNVDAQEDSSLELEDIQEITTNCDLSTILSDKNADKNYKYLLKLQEELQASNDIELESTNEDGEQTKAKQKTDSPVVLIMPNPIEELYSLGRIRYVSTSAYIARRSLACKLKYTNADMLVIMHDTLDWFGFTNTSPPRLLGRSKKRRSYVLQYELGYGTFFYFAHDERVEPEDKIRPKDVPLIQRQYLGQPQQYLAVKGNFINKPETWKQFLNEAYYCRLLSETEPSERPKNIVRCLWTFTTRRCCCKQGEHDFSKINKRNPVYGFIVMERLGKNMVRMLEDDFRQFSPDMICHIFEQIGAGIEYLHDNHLTVHGNLSLTSIVTACLDSSLTHELFLSHPLKLIDFSEAKTYHASYLDVIYRQDSAATADQLAIRQHNPFLKEIRKLAILISKLAIVGRFCPIGQAYYKGFNQLPEYEPEPFQTLRKVLLWMSTGNQTIQQGRKNIQEAIQEVMKNKQIN